MYFLFILIVKSPFYLDLIYFDFYFFFKIKNQIHLLFLPPNHKLIKMKKIFLITIMSVLLSCDTDDIQTTDPIIGVWYASGSFTNALGITSDFETTLTYLSSGSATNESIFTGDFNQDGVIQTNDSTIEFSWENTSPSPDFDSLNHIYNVSTNNPQTGEVNVTTVVWNFGEDYGSAISTTQDGQINNWTRR